MKTKELKTLKDIEDRELKLEDYASESFDKGTRVYTKKRIDRFRAKQKAEAVKWVKLAIERGEPPSHFEQLIEFFNLTDEDLKTGGEK